jgi:anaerobic dimethyl sulfoxide reductase subunit B (iron-sulfur subunit)
MTKAIYRDKDKCVNCSACIVACNVKHNFSPHPVCPPQADPEDNNLITIYHYGPHIRDDQVFQFFSPMSCMHCADAPCIKACPRSVIYKDREYGVVLVNRDKCIGCKFCFWVCPFGVPRYDNEGKLVLCDMCIDRLREGKKTACEATCVAGAITTGTPKKIAQVQQGKIIWKIAGTEIYK